MCPPKGVRNYKTNHSTAFSNSPGLQVSTGSSSSRPDYSNNVHFDVKLKMQYSKVDDFSTRSSRYLCSNNTCYRQLLLYLLTKMLLRKIIHVIDLRKRVALPDNIIEAEGFIRKSMLAAVPPKNSPGSVKRAATI